MNPNLTQYVADFTLNKQNSLWLEKASSNPAPLVSGWAILPFLAVEDKYPLILACKLSTAYKNWALNRNSINTPIADWQREIEYIMQEGKY